MLALLLLAAALAAPAASRPQTDIAAQLEAHWKNKNFYLRGFPASDHWQTDDRGLPIKPLAIESWTEAGIHVTNVHRKGSQLRVEGDRVFFVYDLDHKRWRARLVPDDERIEIDVSPIPTDLDALQSGLFLTGNSELYANVPDEWKPVLSGANHDAILAAFTAAAGVAPLDKVRIPPKQLYVPDPDFTPIARKIALQGSDLVAVVIGVDGTIKQQIITQPLGAGLDDAAVAAIRTWRFAPPLAKDGTPQPCAAEIQVSFKLLH
jgi:TonB family protein